MESNLRSNKNTAVWSAYASLLQDPMVCFAPPEGDGDGGSGGQGGTPPQTGGDGGTPPQTGGEGMFSQAQLNSIVGSRVTSATEKLKTQHQEQMSKVLSALGVEDMDGLEALTAKRKEAEQKKLEEEGKLRELMAQREAEYTAELTRRDTEITNLQAQQRASAIERRLLTTLSDAINPEQAARLILMDGRVQMDDNGAIVVMDNDGHPRLDVKTGQNLGLGQYVEEWFGTNPHFKRAAPGTGGNSRPNGSGAPPAGGGEPLDFARMKTDGDYLMQNAEAAVAALRAQEKARGG